MNRVDPCESCSRSLIWLRHVRTGNIAPIEFAPADNGNIVPVDADGDPAPIVSAVSYRIKKRDESWDAAKNGPLYLNHFASCLQAHRHHRQHRRGAAA